MPYTPDWTLLTNAFQLTPLGGLEWIVGLLASILTCAIITRDTERWKILLCPAMAAWTAIGVPRVTVGYAMLMFIAFIPFAIESLSTVLFGKIIKPIIPQKKLPILPQMHEARFTLYDKADRLKRLEKLKLLDKLDQLKRLQVGKK